ncbi:MAG TPA: sigma-54 dependent transcriptional regulator [Gemmataceae bacterium]
MSNITILLISVDQPLIATVRKIVESIGNLRLSVQGRAEDAEACLQRREASLVLYHLATGAPSTPASGLLRTVAATGQSLPVLILSDCHQAEQALTLLRQGAADYLSRPLDLNHLASLIDALTVRARYRSCPQTPAEPPVIALGNEQDFLFNPAAEMGLLMEQVQRVAPKDTTILLGGETGTGKTSLARLIHELSPRRQQPFLVVNCGALSANLIESELFGHVKGAFTGADRDRTGKCASVGSGTLLLDDIDALPADLQAKLLRVVEERVFEPIGSNKLVRLQARLIVASNRHLDQEVAGGRFRSDLYYRLNVVGFCLPPLRERRRLVRPLVEKYFRDFAGRDSQPVQAISPQALRVLQEHDWPGNIRELRNVIERAVALCGGTEIGLEDLPVALRRGRSAGESEEPVPTFPSAAEGDSPEIASVSEISAFPSAGEGESLAQTKEMAEARRIAATLQKHNNNRLRAAAELGISRNTLYNKLHRYGLMAELAR